MIDYARLGTITEINNDFPVLRGKVQISGSEEIESVVLWNGWGENSYPTIGSRCIVFILNGEFAKKYALPFNVKDAVSILSGEKIIFTPNGSKIYLKRDGSINIEASKEININIKTNINGDCNVNGNIDTTGVYKVNGIQVVKEQQPAIPDPLVGLPEVHAAVDSILIALRNHGLIQT